MATHPYISGAGNITQIVMQLRKSFPGTINSETVKKLGLAPNNESYVISVLQFIGVIDSEGKKTSEAAKVFSQHKDEDFSKHFGALIQKAYSALFDLHGNDAWKLSNDDLITFFRKATKRAQRLEGVKPVLSKCWPVYLDTAICRNRSLSRKSLGKPQTKLSLRPPPLRRLRSLRRVPAETRQPQETSRLR
ncbi:MAG: DUF5343 domain-containing protein [Bryobacteraceae bacterium]